MSGASPMPFLHALSRRNLGGGMGWYAPKELADSEQGVTFALPVDVDGLPFSAYRVEYWRGLDGPDERWHGTLVRPTAKRLVLPLDEVRLVLHERMVFSAYRVLRYRGRLSHPDFAHGLVEYEPEDDGDLDLLYLEHRVVVIGCNPHAHYADRQ